MGMRGYIRLRRRRPRMIIKLPPAALPKGLSRPGPFEVVGWPKASSGSAPPRVRRRGRRVPRRASGGAARSGGGAGGSQRGRGLDGTIEGGIPRGHVVVIAGPTGSMKTSLGLHILAKNRAAGLRGVYVTIEEGRDSLLETMRRFGLGGTEDFLVDIGRLR